MASKKCCANNSDLEEGEILPLKSEQNAGKSLPMNEQFVQYYFHLLQNLISQTEPLDLSIKKSNESQLETESLSPNSSSEVSFLSNDDSSNTKRLSCNICDKSFNKQSSLARHKYEHSGRFT